MRVLTVLWNDLLNASKLSEIRYDRKNRLKRLLICIGAVLFCLLIMGIVYFEMRLVAAHTDTELTFPVRICVLVLSLLSALFSVRYVIYTEANLIRIGALPLSDSEILHIRCTEALLRNMLFPFLICLCLSAALCTDIGEGTAFFFACMLLPPAALQTVHIVFLLGQKSMAVPPKQKAGMAALLAVTLAAMCLALLPRLTAARLLAAWAGLLLSYSCLIHLAHACFFDVVAQNRPVAKTYVLNTTDQTQARALYEKEMRMVLGDKLFMVNSSFGVVVLLAAAVLLAVLPLERLLSEKASLIYSCIPVIFALIISTCCTTYCSFSLEGKNKWIYQSVPVSVMDIARAKIAVNMTVSVPAVLIAGCISSARTAQSAPVVFLMSFLLPLLSAAIISMFGCLIDMWLCNTEWENAQVLIKQTKTYPITLLGGLYLSSMTGAAVYFLHESFGLRNIYIVLLMAYLLILGLIHFCLKKKAASFRFEKK